MSYKNKNHQLMYKKYIIFIRKNLLHVSTPLGHLQGEQFRYITVALIQLSENVPLTSHSVEREVNGTFSLNCVSATLV
jgi:Tfp pilus assembly protein PilZ